MKYETLTWILIAILLIVGVVLSIAIRTNDSKIIKDKNRGKKILNSVCVITIIALALILPYGKHYSLESDKKEWTKFHIPQVDSTMYLMFMDKNNKIYISNSKDSILHISKIINYDLFNVDKITDQFYNKKKNLKLEMTFINENLFRKEKRINLLIKDSFDVVIDNLNEVRKDSLLKEWGFDDKLYKQDNRY